MFLGLAAWAGILLLCHALWGWVPLLDSANLAFHEAGHPLVGFVSERLAVYGGTLMQLMMPAAAAFESLREGRMAAFHFCVIWLAENLLNVACYMADARAHELPLVGGLDPEYSHDWTEILTRWNLLEADTTLAVLLRLVAVALMAGSLFSAWRLSREAGGVPA